MVNTLIKWLDSPPLALRLKVAKFVTWVSYIGLVVTFILNGIHQGAPLSIHVITLLPLLIFLPSMIRQNYRSYSMLCFVCLMYFTLITVNLFEPQKTILDVLEMTFVSLLFIFAMFLSRWIREYLVKQNTDLRE